MDGLEFYPEGEQINMFHWSWVYAHGQLEEDNHYDIGDFNLAKPENPGLLSCKANGRDSVVRLVFQNGILQGRICYLDDVNCMKYLLQEEKWG